MLGHLEVDLLKHTNKNLYDQRILNAFYNFEKMILTRGRCMRPPRDGDQELLLILVLPSTCIPYDW